MSVQSIGIKIWGDLKDLTSALSAGKKQVGDFSNESKNAFKSLYADVKQAERAYLDMAAAFGKGSSQAQAAMEKLKPLREQLAGIKEAAKGNSGIFSEMQKEIIGLGAGFFGTKMVIDNFFEALKTGIESALEEERAEKKLKLALDGNSEATERLLRFREELMNSTLFSKDEIMNAINMGVSLGRTEMETKKMVETAMGLSRVTGVDLNTAMLQLSGTYEGNVGKLGKLAGEVKNLTKEQLAAGGAVDILNEKFGKFAHEGMETMQGEAIQLKKTWNESLESLGTVALKVFKGLKEGINAITTVMAGGVDMAALNEKRLAGPRQQIKAIQDNIAAMREQAKADQNRNVYLEELTAKENKQTGALKNQNTELQRYIQYMKALNAGKVAGPAMPNAFEFNEGRQYNKIDTIESKPTPEVIEGSNVWKPAKVGMAGLGKEKDAAKQVTDLGKAIKEVEGLLSGFNSAFTNVFSSIGNLVEKAAKKFEGGWKEAMVSIGQVVSSVVGAIGSIISESFANRQAQMDAYYDNEKERITNSHMSETEKNKKLDKLNKEQEKKRKEMMREQAKDAKAVAVIQAIIAGALAVVTALSAGPITGIVLAAVVGALAAVQIAAIISQPVPALAQGGLATGKTLAMVGDNFGASQGNPEVIAPLDKLRSLLGFNNESQGGELTASISGDNLLFILDRAQINRKRMRGY